MIALIAAWLRQPLRHIVGDLLAGFAILGGLFGWTFLAYALLP